MTLCAVGVWSRQARGVTRLNRYERTQLEAIENELEKALLLLRTMIDTLDAQYDAEDKAQNSLEQQQGGGDAKR